MFKTYIEIIFLSILSISCLVSNSAWADEFSVVFPDSNNPRGINESYDFGIKFSTIQNVSLNFEASGQPGIYRFCDLNRLECSIVTEDAELLWLFSSEPGDSFIFGTQVITNSPLPYRIDLTSESSFFLNGQGNLSISYNGSGCGSCTIETLRPPTLKITDMELIVEGAELSTSLIPVWLLLLQ